MDKVVLPKEVANAIEEVWITMDTSCLIRHLALTNWGMLYNKYPRHASCLQRFARYNPVEYMRALVEGYDIEESPEEELVRLKEENKEMKQNFRYLYHMHSDEIVSPNYTDRDKLIQYEEQVKDIAAKFI